MPFPELYQPILQASELESHCALAAADVFSTLYREASAFLLYYCKLQSDQVVPKAFQSIGQSIDSITMGRTLVYPKVQKNTVHRKDSRGKSVLQMVWTMESNARSL